MFVFTNITYKWPGGAENLVYLLVRQLYLSKKEKVKIFGKSDSYLVKRLKDEDISFHFFDIDEISAYEQIEKTDVLVLFSNYYGLERFKRSGCQVLVWNILTYSIVTWNKMQFLKDFPGSDFIRSSFNKSFIRFLCKRNAIVCMSGPTRQELYDYLNDERITIDLLQVPILIKENKYNCKQRSCINITYIGRGDEIWKVMPVKKIVMDIVAAHSCAHVHIFTSDSSLFEQHLSSIDNGDVRVSFYTGYYGERLEKALAEISDVNFSMGIAALESAALGIPTVLIDPSLDKYPLEYRYRWLYQAVDYSLGEEVSEHTVTQRGGMTMSDVFCEIMEENNSYRHSELCYAYVKENYAVDIVLKKFLNHSSYVNVRSISRFMPNMWF